MSDPNEPRLMSETRPQEPRKDDHASGNAARDGFSVLSAAPKRSPQSYPYDYCEQPGQMKPLGRRTYEPGSYED